MRIAIAAPCPVPYVVGGAEKLWWGLAQFLNRETPHQADIIKLPSPEANFPSLMESYRRFSELDLSGFDCVISTKYPAWMVHHPNHVVYLQHRLRGLYDSYPRELPTGCSTSHPRVHALLQFIRSNAPERQTLPEVFGRWAELREDADALRAFALPGPCARAVVHFLDAVALDAGAIRRFSTIAHTVAQRLDYFPDNVEVSVAHHPSNLEVTGGEAFSYFFTASRLDAPKRLDLLIAAFRAVSTDRQLWIAGVGPDEQRLRGLARGDGRIRFLGFVSDRELGDLYRSALAVPFVPYQEDYGLVTVEAMMAGKPVITTTDAGGPTEIVEHERTGLIVDASTRALASGLERLASDIDLARALGTAGRARVAEITWSNVLENVLPRPHTLSTSATKNRCRSRKLLVATTFPVWPPRFGGPSRVFHLYRELTSHFDVCIVSLGDAEAAGFDREIAPGMREIRIQKSYGQVAREAAASVDAGIPVTDILAPDFVAHTPKFMEALRSEASSADVLVACHPYLFPLLDAVGANREVWYEAQDVESSLKAQMLPATPVKPSLLSKVEALERACCARARWVIPCSEDDATVFEQRFGVSRDRIAVVRNGTDTREIRFVSGEQRAARKTALGVGDPLILFMASGHHPNIDAAHQIFVMARALPEFRFLFAGHVAYAFLPSDVPPNVWLLGEVSETARQLVLEAADVAINPLRFGSGTSLKLLDYFAAGIPAIATPVGARGFPVVDDCHLLLRELNDFPSALRALVQDSALAERLSREARLLVEATFDWRQIAAKFLQRIAGTDERASTGCAAH